MAISTSIAPTTVLPFYPVQSADRKVEFGTKAETLDRLSDVITRAKVLPQIRFTVAHWHAKPHDILARIHSSGWIEIPCIVRSSAKSEDSGKESQAGKYTSVLNVLGTAALNEGISKVIGSFDSGNWDDQVFVQPMITNSVCSGVAFTKDPSSGSSYYVINYTDSYGSTDAVTSGNGENLKTCYVWKSGPRDIDSSMKQVIDLLAELEDLTGTDSLDIEFAFTMQNELYLLQARPLISSKPVVPSACVSQALVDIHNRIVDLNRRHPYLHGNKTVFGIMPDWNPAEIVGLRPRPLALSLYKEIITDAIWAYQRDNYGYKNLRSFPLLVHFCGLPYIDVRVSFNSFLPADLDDDISERLVDYYINRLIDCPYYHDKVEFEIIFSCYTLDLPQRLEVLTQHGFSATERALIANSLRKLTNKIIDMDNGLWLGDIAKIHKLENRIGVLAASDLDIVSKIYWLLEDCKRYGTLPFAGLARAGFIAVQFLQSMVSTGIIDAKEYQCFIASLDTVSSRLKRDFSACSREEFLRHYGHLRPGTYDILSPSYGKAPDYYFDWANRPAENNHTLPSFVLSLPQLRKVENMLKESNINHDVLSIFDFIKGAIEGREYSKFVFTKSVSMAIDLFADLGATNNYSLEQCSFASIDCIRELYASSASATSVLQKSINEGKRGYELTKSLILPPLITGADDIYAFHIPPCQPNFVTDKKAEGKVTTTETPPSELAGTILMIPGADPGYDWIFSHGIAGFITMHGGVNSHMAIRAGELGIPAVVGAGEVLYNKWFQGRRLSVDCANHLVTVLG